MKRLEIATVLAKHIKSTFLMNRKQELICGFFDVDQTF